MDKQTRVEFVLCDGHKYVLEKELPLGKLEKIEIVLFGIFIATCFTGVVFFEKLIN